MNRSSTRTLAAVLALAFAADALADGAPPAPPPTEPRPVLLLQLGAGVAAAAITAPTSIWLGQWVSQWTGSDLGALPALLLAAVVPPVAVSLASWFTGNWGGPERFHLSPAIWIATGVNVVALVAAGFLGFNAAEPGQLAVYTAADAVVLPAVAVGTMQLTASPAPVSLLPAEHRLPRVASIPVVRLQF